MRVERSVSCELPPLLQYQKEGKVRLSKRVEDGTVANFIRGAHLIAQTIQLTKRFPGGNCGTS